MKSIRALRNQPAAVVTPEVQHPDRVVFRKEGDQGDIVAFLPDAEVSPGQIWCYSHIGQHGAASLNYYHTRTRPAAPGEYRELARELRGMGYKLKIQQRLFRRVAK